MAKKTSTAETSSTSTSIADLPTGEPIPAPPTEPSKQTDSRPAAKKTSLRALLASLPRDTDAFIQHLQRCLSTPSGIDTLLLFICYTSRLSGALLSSLSQYLLRRRSAPGPGLVALLALTLPPRTAIILSSSAANDAKALPAAASRTVEAAAQLAALLAARLKKLGGLASEARTIARLWALVGMYFWAKRLALRLVPSGGEKEDGAGSGNGSKGSRLAALVDWAQLLSCAAFQVLENGAYLSSRGVLGWTPQQQARASVVGSRWLGVYTALELGRLLADFVAHRQGYAVKSDEEMGALRRSAAINLAWAPLTVHWSMEKPLLGDALVGLGGCIPGVIQMSKLWRDTAQ